jgi:hypothetical protein
MPFEQAATNVAFFWGVELDETTVRRYTQAAGAAYVAEQAAELERLQRERPLVPPGPDVQYLSADGAMVPLVGGQWAEVKTLAIGAVEVRPGDDGLPQAHTTGLSYFSRLGHAETLRATHTWRPTAVARRPPKLSARCRMEPNGSKGWWTCSDQTPYGLWILHIRWST